VSKLLTAIEKFSPLEERSRKAFLQAWQVWELPKNYQVLKAGCVSDYIYFLEKGAVRIFYHKKEKEVTEWIALDEQFFLSITSFFNRVPSNLSIETLEPSLLYGIPHHELMQMADQYHEVERLLRKMVTGSLILSQIRMDSIQFETAQERYEKLLESSPQIIQRIPLSYIASFLGVTLETLSRIRSSSRH
jgi:CRP-like cAMP-binding protein